jgi:hypothetical protein
MRLLFLARDVRIPDVYHFWLKSFAPTPGLLVGNGTCIIYDTGLGSLSLTNIATSEHGLDLAHSGAPSRSVFDTGPFTHDPTGAHRPVIFVRPGNVSAPFQLTGVPGIS